MQAAFTKNQCCANDTCVVPIHDVAPLCEYDNKYYRIGESFKIDCNTCTCGREGVLGCTKMACLPRCGGDLVWNECASACPDYCGKPSEIACIAVCRQACDCPRGTIRSSANSTTCVEPNECGLKNQTISCRTDRDCPRNHWCRSVDENFSSFQCTPFAKEGENCNGYTMPQHYEKCAPGFSCEERGSPLIVDAPGTCTSLVENCRVELNNESASYWPYSGSIFRNYSVGESFQGFGQNWCNRCMCMDSGGVTCTEMACAPCSNPVNCFTDPCEVSSCPLFPNATCTPNYCVGCVAEYFLGGRKVNCTAD